MKKRLVKNLLLVLTMVVLCFAVGVMASAEEFTENGFIYEVEDGNAVIVGCDSTVSGDVVIPSSLGGYVVTEIGDRAFEDNIDITGVTVPDSVTKIGDNAFASCFALETVIIGDGVKTIGEESFYKCQAMKKISLGDSLKTIGGYAFNKCVGLKSVDIPYGVVNIGSHAFASCAGLTGIVIPDSVTVLGNQAFSLCTGLRSVTLSNKLTEIDNATFSFCSGLTEIVIPDSVSVLGQEVFRHCVGLKSVTLPKNLTEISAGLFYGCSGLTSIDVPTGVTGIDSQAFQGATGLTNINIPNTVTYIGWSAFRETNLKTVTLPASVNEVEAVAFYLCDNLESIKFYNPDCVIYDDIITIDPETITIYGYANSTAHNYAVKYNRPFVELEDEVVEEHTHTYVYRVEMLATCKATGKITHICECGVSYTEETPVNPEGHIDFNFDGKCDLCYVEPDEPCDCICHKNGLAGFIYKLIRSFFKFFKTNKACSCGIMHY